MDKSIENKGVKEKLGANFNKPLTNMKRIYIAILFFSFCTLGFSQEQKIWDFEEGKGEWTVWGTRNDIPIEKLNEVVTVSEELSYSGKKCLLIKDELDNLNPYAITNPPIPIDISKTYVFSGWIRSDTERIQNNVIQTFAENSNGKFLKVVNITTFSASTEWKEFKIVVEKFPKETSKLWLAIFPTSEKDYAATGKVYVDDIRFYEQRFKKIDISSVVNREFKDEKEGDNIGGWTDQGDNDLRGIKTGNITIGNIPFNIIEPSKNENKSVLVLRDAGKPAFLENASIEINETCDWIYLLHTAAWAATGKISGFVDINYQDGTSNTVKIIPGEQIGDWWRGNAKNAYGYALYNVNIVRNPVYIFALGIANPVPQKKIKEITFRTDKNNKAIWLILGVTLGTGSNVIEKFKVADRDYSKWAPFSIKPRHSPKALVDLSFLLDAPAGKHGFLKVKDGHFVFEDGTRARFFGINIHSYGTLFPSKEQAEKVAETLTRYGVNIVRFHLLEHGLIDDTKKNRQTFISEEKWEPFDYFIKCLKDKGIYILVDSVTGLSARKFQPADKVVGDDAYYSHRPWAYYDPRLKELGKAYMKGLLTHTNKYTEKCLIDDPVLVLVTLINEQSIFWDWEDFKKGTPEYYTTLLKKLYNEWLVKTYDNREKLAKAWTNSKGICALLPDEDPVKGNIIPVSLKNLSAEDNWTGPDIPARVSSTIQFLKSVQVDYYKEMKDYLYSIGVKVPIAGTNVVMDTADLETHLVMDYTSQNRYYDHIVYNSDKSLFMHNIPSVEVNPLLGFSDRVLLESAIASVKINGHPVTSTESDMMWPHEWRSSYFLSLASTAAFQDWDAIFHYCYFGGSFNKLERSWNTAENIKVILASTVQFNDPALMGVFPAANLIFHRRDILPAKNLVQIIYSGNDKIVAKGSLHEGAFPFNYLPFVSRVESVFDKPDGKANFTIGADGEHSMKYSRLGNKKNPVELPLELDDLLKKSGLLNNDRGLQKGKLISDTAEIIRDWDKGILLINSERTQGFSGFPFEPIKLSDVEIQCKSDFATIVISSLENKPISKAKRLLLTAVGRAENDKDKISYGEMVKGNSGVIKGERMTVVRGEGGQVRIEQIEASIKLKATSVTLTPLDPDFAGLSEPVKINGKDNIVTIDIGKFATIWYLIEINK